MLTIDFELLHGIDGEIQMLLALIFTTDGMLH
jgi:hypothetical protein